MADAKIAEFRHDVIRTGGTGQRRGVVEVRGELARATTLRSCPREVYDSLPELFEPEISDTMKNTTFQEHDVTTPRRSKNTTC